MDLTAPTGLRLRRVGGGGRRHQQRERGEQIAPRE